MNMEKQKDLRERILFEAADSKLPCEKAFHIALEVGCTQAEIGKQCNEVGVKIISCQLGCF